MKLYAKGSRVKQAVYGSGTVASSDERYTVVEFDDRLRRTFVTEMVKLEASHDPPPNPPEKPARRKSTKAVKAAKT